jgi:hypothetical protein
MTVVFAKARWSCYLIVVPVICQDSDDDSELMSEDIKKSPTNES